MKPGEEKLQKVLDLLKRSEPLLSGKERFSDEVMGAIVSYRKKSDLTGVIFEYLFGWVYVGWVRRSLVTVSLAIILFFGYEQTVLMKRLGELSGKKYPDSASMMNGIKGNYSGKLLLFRFFGGKTKAGNIDVSEDQIDNFINSVNELQTEYKDIIRLMEQDPRLKKYVEEKLNDTKRKRNKI